MPDPSGRLNRGRGDDCSAVGGLHQYRTRYHCRRFDDGLIDLLRLRWWDFEPEPLAELLPLLCDQDLERVRQTLTGMLA